MRYPRKFLLLVLMPMFGFLMGNRICPILFPALAKSASAATTQSDSNDSPIAFYPYLGRAPEAELMTTFPQVPLRLQPPVYGVTDLTEATIAAWLSYSSNEVFLTFDDGPSPIATAMILDILREHDAKATFFVLGRNAVLFPELIQRIVADGHELALHSLSHADMLTIDHPTKVHEIAAGLSILHWYFPDLRIRWFRPPYGNYDQDTVDIAHDFGLCLAMFNEISTDSHSSAEQIAQTIRQGWGKILVFHDGQMPRPANITPAEERLVQGLAAAIGSLKAQGAEFKTLSSHFGHFCP